MNRGPSSFRSLAVAAGSDSAAAMSFSPYFRGGRPQGRRGFSDRTLGPTSGNYSEFVSGDSHFSAVRDANRGFRPSYNAVPSPPHYGTGQEFYVPGSQHHRSAPPVLQQLQGPRPRPYKHPRRAGPSFGNYQPFRPQQMQQQFRPRPSKPPDYREWDYAKPRPPPHCELFTILSYNILADYLATDHWQKLYFHIPRYIMDWNWRKRNLIFELGLWSADIICFQEVDRFQELEAELKPHGYSGIWKMRTGDPADGCAMFWRVSRFKLMHEESIEYNKLGLRDNVAQICVFESQNGLSNSNGVSTPSTSCGSAPSNRVVICNIHVLFNPKRGDVKLGQIRVLLERAYAISKLWDDAPIVICGDFNCTPKSPMYNFITEQKLDLSEVARDKISGQASAEIRPPRPAYPDYRKEAVDDSIQASAVTCDKTEQRGFPLHAQKFACFHSSTNSPSAGSDTESGCSVVDKTFDSCIDEKHGSRIADDLPSRNTTHSLASESMSTQGVPPHILDECLTSAQDDTKSPVCPTRDANKISLLESSCIQFKEIEFRECVESNLQTSNAPDDQIKHLFSNEDHSSDLAITSELTGTYNSDTSQVEGTSKKLFPNSHDVISSNQEAVASSVSVATDNHAKPSYRSSCQSVSADFMLDENFESLSLNELADGATDGLFEDSGTFLSELHNIGQNPFPDDLDSRSPNHKSHSHGDEILSDTVYDEDEIVTDAGKSSFSPAAWTPAEIQIASGSADCKVMEHPLKLQSAYAEVENPSGLRDSSGEPLVTSYHRRFLGTVDYIWRSEGLQTAKVLAPIPKQVMQQTRGFPTKKWGSDHIALVAELAFTRNISSEKGRQ